MKAKVARIPNCYFCVIICIVGIFLNGCVNVADENQIPSQIKPVTGDVGLQQWKTSDLDGAIGVEGQRYRVLVGTGKTYSLNFIYQQSIGGANNPILVSVESETGVAILAPARLLPTATLDLEFDTGTESVVTVFIRYDRQRPGFNAQFGFQILPSVQDGLIQDESTQEPNNTPSTASAIVLSQKKFQLLTGADHDRRDNYSFAVVSGHTYTLVITVDNKTTSVSAQARLVTEVRDVKDRILVQTANTGVGQTSNYEFTARDTGIVVVKIAIPDDIGLDNFQYFVTIWPAAGEGLEHDPLTQEPNDSPSTAFPMEMQKTYIAELLHRTGSDNVDYYSAPISANQTYAVGVNVLSATAAGANSELRFTLTSQSGEVLLSEQVVAGTLGRNVEFTSHTNGYARIYLYSKFGAAIQYRYNITLLPRTGNGLVQDSISFEPNNTASTGYPITLATSYDSEIAAGYDYRDYYRLTVEAGKTYSISVGSTLAPAGAGNALRLAASNDVGSILLPEKTVPLATAAVPATTYTFVPLVPGTAIIELYASTAALGQNYKYNFSVTAQ